MIWMSNSQLNDVEINISVQPWITLPLPIFAPLHLWYTERIFSVSMLTTGSKYTSLCASAHQNVIHTKKQTLYWTQAFLSQVRGTCCYSVVVHLSNLQELTVSAGFEQKLTYGANHLAKDNVLHSNFTPTCNKFFVRP